ncbi:MAG: Rab family GTPase [Candidatus Helarchaeota archaeon]
MVEYGFKLVLLGDEGVGKSSLIVRYIKNKFLNEYISTIGVDFLTKNLVLNGTDNVRLIIWDIAGQEHWRKKLHLYLKGCDGAILVVDLTRKKTLDGLNFWTDSINEHAPGVPQILVGNKLDLVESRNISSSELKDKTNFPTFETSAKTGERVEKIFETIARLMIEHKQKNK